MKVWIDQDLCTGDGLCEEIAPDVFFGQEDGLFYVKEYWDRHKNQKPIKCTRDWFPTNGDYGCPEKSTPIYRVPANSALSEELPRSQRLCRTGCAL